jgi:hypothetical protein
MLRDYYVTVRANTSLKRGVNENAKKKNAAAHATAHLMLG